MSDSRTQRQQVSAIRSDAPDLDFDTIQAYVRRGEALRAQAISGAFRALVRWLTGRRANPAEAPNPALDALSALTAIKASAEVLRDCPDIDAAERSRFTGIVLSEEARLERMVRELFGKGQGRTAAS